MRSRHPSSGWVMTRWADQYFKKSETRWADQCSAKPGPKHDANKRGTVLHPDCTLPPVGFCLILRFFASFWECGLGGRGEFGVFFGPNGPAAQPVQV